MEQKEQPAPAKSSGFSCAILALVGCGVIAVLGVVTVGGLGFFGWRFLTQQIEEFAEPFQEQGYVLVKGQVVVEQNKVTEPKVYAVQVLKLEDGASNSLAIMAQVAEVRGTVEGDIDFMGQILDIKDGAVVQGDIRAKAAQVIKVRGLVEGEISGSYQQLDQRDAARRPTDDATADTNSEAEAAPEAQPATTDEATENDR